MRSATSQRWQSASIASRVAGRYPSSFSALAELHSKSADRRAAFSGVMSGSRRVRYEPQSDKRPAAFETRLGMGRLGTG